MADVLRTPDERFNELLDFPFAPRFPMRSIRRGCGDSRPWCPTTRRRVAKDGMDRRIFYGYRNAGSGPWPPGDDGAAKIYKRVSETP